MSVTIMEVLQSAEINVETIQKRLNHPILGMAKEQLSNAIKLLDKGYSLDDVFDDLVEKHGSVDAVPQKEAR